MSRRRLRCWLGLHRGNVHPAHEIEEELDVDVGGRSAFVCNYCGEVIEDVGDAFERVDRTLRLFSRFG